MASSVTKPSTTIDPPRIVLILSGKRKSGKDFVAESIVNRFGKQHAVILRLSGPLKYQYAKERGLDYDRLLEASNYKEIYREDMIVWGEQTRNRDPGFFCRHAIEQASTDLRHFQDGTHGYRILWVISDARRPTDLAFFKTEYGLDRVRTVKIYASEQVRKNRGWVFTPGVDDVESECALDKCDQWDFLIENEGNSDEHLRTFLDQIEQLIKT